ncbi:unnamed protein product, partial [Brugia timori]|uniref:Ovule protein n=1 Tax=Brugia timori TaxID=42155 RepID=A0A0R3QXJ3_9BILA
NLWNSVYSSNGAASNYHIFKQRIDKEIVPRSKRSDISENVFVLICPYVKLDNYRIVYICWIRIGRIWNEKTGVEGKLGDRWYRKMRLEDERADLRLLK